MVGKEPDVSLMMAHDNGEACDSEAEEGEASAEDSADIEDVATDVSEAAVADEEIIEVIIGGVGTSGGQSGGRSSGGTTSAACWGPRLLLDEPLESAKVVVEVVMGAVVVVVATVVVTAVTGVVVVAVSVVFLPTPPRLIKSSIENFNAVGKSNPSLAKTCPGLWVAAIVMIVNVVNDVVTGEGLAEVDVGVVELTDDNVEGVHLAGVIAGLDDVSRDVMTGEGLAEVNVGVVELADEVGRSVIPVRSSLDLGLISISSGHSISLEA